MPGSGFFRPFGDWFTEKKAGPATFHEAYDHFGNRNVEYYTYKGVQNQPSPYLNFTAGNNRVAPALRAGSFFSLVSVPGGPPKIRPKRRVDKLDG